MEKIIYSFFCESCGGDTAAFQMLGVCPYCHATRPALQLVAKLNSSEHASVQQMLQERRTTWINHHQDTLAGEPVKRRRRRMSL